MRRRFIGRTDVLKTLEDALWEHGTHALVVMGPPGVGKTRLVQELGHSLAHIHNWRGVWYCDLDGVRHGWEVIERIADTVGLSLSQTTQNIELPTLLQALKHDCPGVLILDSLERLNDDGIAIVKQLVEWEDEDLRLVMTTRDATALRPFAQHVLELPPLSLSSETTYNEAMLLLLDRAQGMWPQSGPSPRELTSLNAIARKLEGLPLALELAAARLAILEPSEILERLDACLALLTFPGAGARVPLRAAIDTSWELLSDETQMVFAQCAIFPEYFELKAAQSIFLQDSETIPSHLQSLTERSLLQRTNNGEHESYRLLSSIREYCLEQLDTMNLHGQLEERYTSHFAQHADALRAQIEAELDATAFEELSGILVDLRAIIELSPKYTTLIKRRCIIAAGLAIASLLHRGNVLDVEDKLLAVLDDGKDIDASDAELQLARGKILIELWHLNRQRGQHQKRRLILEEALEWAQAHDNPALNAWVWRSKAAELWTGGNAKQALVFAEKAIVQARLANHTVFEARAMSIKAWIYRDLGDLESTWSLSSTSIQLLKQTNVGLVHALESTNQATLLYQLGALEASLNAHQAIIERLARSGGYMYVEAQSRKQIMLCMLVLGHDNALHEHLARCAVISHKTGRSGIIATNLAYQSCLELRQNNVEQACEYAQKAVALRRQGGNKRLLLFALKNLVHIQMSSDQMTQARASAEKALALTAKTRTTVVRVELLSLLALCSARLAPEKARELLTEAQALAAEASRPLVGLEVDTCHLELLLTQDEAHEHAQQAAWDVMKKALTHHPPSFGLPGAPRPLYQTSLSFKHCAQRLYSALQPTTRAKLWAQYKDPDMRGLTATDDGHFRLPEGEWLDLGNRKTLRRLIQALVTHRRTHGKDAVLSLEACLAAGWPGEKAASESAVNRLYQVISRLRRIGFKKLVIAEDGGYRLPPDVGVWEVPQYLP